MIAITKIACPKILTENAVNWTKELLAAIAAGADTKTINALKGRYNHVQVKAALKEETHEKCAYCESKPLHVTHGDIEHVTPKKSAPDKTFEWENLTLACDVCNTKKGSTENVIDPYTANPEDEFEFLGPMVMHKFGREDAQVTIELLELNRTPLIEKRKEKIDAIGEKLKGYAAIQNAAARDVIRAKYLVEIVSAEAEFAATAKATLPTFQAAGYF